MSDIPATVPPASHANIPQEMRHYDQWVLWRLEERQGTKPTKVPYNAHSGLPASVTDRGDWCSYDYAVKCMAQDNRYTGIGFVFTDADPFTGVDLDSTNGDQDATNTQRRIFDLFNSYSEISPSLNGLHIICRGAALSGRRRGSVELYSSGRFFTMTGNLYHDAPIRECQALIDILWTELGGHVNSYVYGGDIVEALKDHEIVAKAENAVNGVKFSRLHVGNWQQDYPSQSEADQAYMNFLAFYTQHRDQLMRMFRMSPLGQRDKANRNSYLDYTINRAFDQMLPPIDIDGLINRANDALAANAPAPAMVQIDLSAEIDKMAGKSEISPEIPSVSAVSAGSASPESQDAITWPPGLVGEVASFIYHSSPRPVAEIALAGALGLMAGVCGRGYNVSSTGLNIYLLMLAATGTGKEAMQSGISRFMYAIEKGLTPDSALKAMPAVANFTGPAEISSGQALIKYLQDSNSFVSVVGEFGLTMQRLAHPRATSADIMLKKVLLDLFNKSGVGSVLKPTIYSDKAKNTAAVLSPAFSLLGESTPESYFAHLDETLVSDGLLPRIITLEYNGIRPALNKGHAFVKPDASLVDRFSHLCDNVLKLNAHNKAIDVQYTAEAMAFLDEIELYTTSQINQPDQNDSMRHLWNRAHLKTLKLAALVAVGCNISAPTIELHHAQWAYDLVQRDVLSIQNKFEIGAIGMSSGDAKQMQDVSKACMSYLQGTKAQAHKYGAKAALHEARIIPYTYLQRKLVAMASFRSDKTGATNAIKRTLQSLIDEGTLVEVGPKDLDKYGTRGKAYMVMDFHHLT